MRVLLSVLAVLLISVPALAQAPLASGVITGRVVSLDTGAPLRGAQVRLRDNRGTETRIATSDDQGHFEARNLFAGTWTLTASKAGFITTRYGARRSTDDGKPVAVANGQQTDVTIALSRAGAITGRLLDEYGEPLLGARVLAMRSRVFRGVRQLAPVGTGDSTDDTGAFRLFGLAPGTYYVTASMRTAPPDSDTLLGTVGATTYYPGTTDLTVAQSIVLGAGDESGISFQVVPIRSVRVSGAVLGADGSPAAGANIHLMQPGGFEPGTTVGNFGQSGPDGSFAIINVPPGTYTLMADRPQSFTLPPPPDFVPMNQQGQVPITVGGEDVTGVTVAMSIPGRIQGTIVAAPGERLPEPIEAMLTMQLVGDVLGRGVGLSTSQTGKLPLTFRMPAPTGPVMFDASASPSIVLKSVELNGTDITDKPVELSGADSQLRIVLTAKTTQVKGVVRSNGAPRPDVSVVVFPDDPTKWSYPTRYVAFADTNADGSFAIPRLPPGQNYLAAVVTTLEKGDEYDAAFLAPLRDRATPFSLAEGETRSLNIDLPR